MRNFYWNITFTSIIIISQALRHLLTHQRTNILWSWRRTGRTERSSLFKQLLLQSTLFNGHENMSTVSFIVNEGQFLVSVTDSHLIYLVLMERFHGETSLLLIHRREPTIAIMTQCTRVCKWLNDAFVRFCWRYLGNLTVWFDGQGEVVRWDGNPILLDQSIQQGEFSMLGFTTYYRIYKRRRRGD